MFGEQLADSPICRFRFGNAESNSGNVQGARTAVKQFARARNNHLPRATPALARVHQRPRKLASRMGLSPRCGEPEALTKLAAPAAPTPALTPRRRSSGAWSSPPDPAPPVPEPVHARRVASAQQPPSRPTARRICYPPGSEAAHGCWRATTAQHDRLARCPRERRRAELRREICPSFRRRTLDSVPRAERDARRRRARVRSSCSCTSAFRSTRSPRRERNGNRNREVVQR